MKALSLSKSTPHKSLGNRLCACFIASTTNEPSRVTNGRHSVQPVATSTIVSVWMNEPATEVPPWATISTSQKPGGGLFQSLNVRIGTSRRRGGAAVLRHETLHAGPGLDQRADDREMLARQKGVNLRQVQYRRHELRAMSPSSSRSRFLEMEINGISPKRE